MQTRKIVYLFLISFYLDFVTNLRLGVFIKDVFDFRHKEGGAKSRKIADVSNEQPLRSFFFEILKLEEFPKRNINTQTSKEQTKL